MHAAPQDSTKWNVETATEPAAGLVAHAPTRAGSVAHHIPTSTLSTCTPVDVNAGPAAAAPHQPGTAAPDVRLIWRIDNARWRSEPAYQAHVDSLLRGGLPSDAHAFTTDDGLRWLASRTWDPSLRTWVWFIRELDEDERLP